MKDNDGQSSRDAGVLSNPLSFLRSGDFYWNYAGLDDRGSFGRYWSLRSAHTNNSSSLHFLNTDLGPQYSYAHGYGFAVRSEAFLTLFRVLKRIYGFLLETT